MMTWWDPFPCVDFNADPRVRVLSRAARGVFAQLLAQSRGGDALPYVNHHGGAGTVALIAWCEGDADDAVGDEVAELLAAGLVEFDDGAQTIRLRLSAVGASRRDERAVRPSAPPRDPDRLRALAIIKTQFSKRRLKDFESRLAWLESEHGRKTLDHLGLALADARPLAEAAGRKGGRFGVDRPARRPSAAPSVTSDGGTSTAVTVTSDGGNHGGNVTSVSAVTTEVTPLPPPAPLSLKREQENKQKYTPEAERAHGGNQRVTDGGNSTAVTVTSDGGNSGRDLLAGSGVRCGTEEYLGLDPEVALLAIRTRSRGTKINLAHDARSLAQWSAVVKSLAAPKIAAFEALGDWIAAGGLGWWSQGRPSLSYLLRPGQLATHLEDAAQWDASGRPPITHGAPQNARPHVARSRGPAPVSASFAPKDDPEMMEIFNLEQAAFR